MLFNGTLDKILYPMTADIYYAEEAQSEYGNMVRNWRYDRTVNCSAISAVTGDLDGEIKVKDRIILFDASIYFRTNEDIREKSNGRFYPITAIAITNIKDPSGKLAWTNSENLKTQPGTVKTKYEVKTVVPSFDMNHDVGMYRVYLTRSNTQKWDGAE